MYNIDQAFTIVFQIAVLACLAINFVKAEEQVDADLLKRLLSEVSFNQLQYDTHVCNEHYYLN